MILLHKFRDHQPAADTEILILGTFVHDYTDGPEFFYCKTRSFLWHLLPICYGLPDLKEASLSEKFEFMKDKKVDFMDVIHSIEVEEGDDTNAEDGFIDSSVHEWTDLESVVNSLPKLKAVYFTRKTFNSIPNVRTQVVSLAKFCAEKNIRFCKLDTPAKYFDAGKQKQWKDTIVTQKTCFRV